MQLNIFKWILVAALWLQPGWAQCQEQSLFVTDYYGLLYDVNVTGCSTRLLDSIQPMADIAFTPDGRLWGVIPDTTGGSLYAIDTSNAHATYKGHTTIYGNSLVALNDSTLLMEYGRNLYGIRIRDASTYWIGYIRYPSMGDLAWFGSDLYLAAADTLSSASLLVKIVLNTNYTMVLSAVALNTPDHPIPDCFGLATINLPGTGSSLIGFSRYDAYRINPVDASYEILCDSLPVNLGFSGAASIGSPPGGTSLTAKEKDKVRLSLVPNPSRGQVQLRLDHFMDNPADLSFCLYDYTGRLIIRSNLASLQETIDLGGYRPGLYIIRLQWKDKTIAVEKFVKE